MEYNDVYKDLGYPSEIWINPKLSQSDSYSALVLGWTEFNNSFFNLVPDCLVVGNLRLTSGIDRLITNLSHNPKIDRVYLLDISVYNRTDEPLKKAKKALEELGYSVGLIEDIDHIKIVEPSKRVKNPPRVPRIEKRDIANNVTGIVVRGTDLDEMRNSIMNYIMRYGSSVPSRNFTALPCITSVVEQLPAVSYDPYFEQWLKPNQHKEVSYTYGDFISKDINVLKTDSDSTQLTISLPRGNKNQPPCLCHLQRWQNNLIATFRSHDIGGAYKKNLEALIYLMYMCNIFGKLIVVSNVPHIYNWDLVKIKWTPDSIGNFVLFKEDSKYFATLNGFEIVSCTTKARLRREIIKLFPVMDTEHAMYLERQLSSL